jgi:uncharacterized protein YndB with AHSA1/START domain
MRWFSRIGAVLVVVVLAVIVVGLMLPASHAAMTRSELAASPADVWSTIADWEHWTEWQPELSSVEPLEDRSGHPALMASGSWGDVLMEIVESERPHRLVTVVDGGAFRGRWTYDLEATPGGTVLTITEEGEVTNPLFRTLMVFHDNYETMLGYHRALADRLGVVVEPERVEG